MHTRGVYTPESETDARERYEWAKRVARTVVLEVAKAMDFDREEYDERVRPAVISRARDALFASQLSVTVGTREEFDDWSTAVEGDVAVVGSENVDRVAWHDPPFGEAVAATFQDEEDAAVETLRRQVFGRVYRDRLQEPSA